MHSPEHNGDSVEKDSSYEQAREAFAGELKDKLRELSAADPQSPFTDAELAKKQWGSQTLQKIDACARGLLTKIPELKSLAKEAVKWSAIGSIGLGAGVPVTVAFYGGMEDSARREIQHQPTDFVLEQEKDIHFKNGKGEGYLYHLKEFQEKHPEIQSITLEDVHSTVGKSETSMGVTHRPITGEATVTFRLKKGKAITVHRLEKFDQLSFPNIEKALAAINARLEKAGIRMNDERRDMTGTEIARLDSEHYAVHNCMNAYRP